MIHRVRIARKRLGIAREREAEALAKDRAASDAYIMLDPEAPEDYVWVHMNLMCKSKRDLIREWYSLRAIEQRKDRIA
jgi:hypothetical protein